MEYLKDAVKSKVYFHTAASNDTDSEEFYITLELVPSRIEVPPEAFGEEEVDSPYVLNHYIEPVLFPLLEPDGVNASEFDMVTDSEVIGFTIPGPPIVNLSRPVRYTVQSLRGRRGEVRPLMLSFVSFSLWPIAIEFF